MHVDKHLKEITPIKYILNNMQNNNFYYLRKIWNQQFFNI